MIKREKRLTKRERKALAPPRAQPTTANRQQEQHIHCIACGRHLDPSQFEPPASATVIKCLHQSQFASCVGCVEKSKELLAEHDRTGQAVRTAAAWH